MVVLTRILLVDAETLPGTSSSEYCKLDSSLGSPMASGFLVRVPLVNGDFLCNVLGTFLISFVLVIIPRY